MERVTAWRAHPRGTWRKHYVSPCTWISTRDCIKTRRTRASLLSAENPGDAGTRRSHVGRESLANRARPSQLPFLYWKFPNLPNRSRIEPNRDRQIARSRIIEVPDRGAFRDTRGRFRSRFQFRRSTADKTTSDSFYFQTTT